MTTLPPRLPFGWRRAVMGAAGALAILFVVWSGGLVWFVSASQRSPEPPPKADGIVALTGGADRIETALHLLSDDHATRLLISGLGGNADLTALAHRAGLEPEPLAERVTLGRAAATTRGNAIETRAWANSHHVKSLIVVTAAYHMPRAMAELRRVLPDVALYAYPVLPATNADRPRGPPWRLLVEEYNKYLAAAAGLSTWLPTRGALRNG